ncbi:MAG TPA: flavodoxin family protein [Terracidiphilus sp.]|jgi:NAD(P)H-dependent FMN reductase
MSKKVVAILGTYRKGGIIDRVVEAMLEGARARRATTSTVYLIDKHIEFCNNCRQCAQTPGPERGKCRQEDDLEAILIQIETADAVILATPVNCGNATAIFRRFMERLIGYSYWPWGQPAPRTRSKVHTLKAALVASSAMPGFLIPLFTGTKTALRMAAKTLGAKPVASLWIGLTAGEPHHDLSPRTLARARRIGMKLV